MIAPNPFANLTPRWTQLRYHPEQARLWNSDARFRITGAGRRSGKTELAKRYLVLQALTHHERSDHLDGFYVAAAPTHQQARDIFWEDLKALVPVQFVRTVRESDLTIHLVTGTHIRVAGLDKPQRVEGRPIDGIIIDEYSEMKPEVWEKHILPALETLGRPGWAWVFGIPRGMPHFKRLYDAGLNPDAEEFDSFHWVSADILDPEFIAKRRATMDPLHFQQEFEASWDAFTGRAYYGFVTKDHASRRVPYDPGLPLVFCFDFNRAPGVAAVVQEHQYENPPSGYAEAITAVIGEVYIPRDSTTPAVCRRLIHDWQSHQGRVLCYGDATGGAGGSAKVAGSDWRLVETVLRPAFGDRLGFDVPRQNPRERVRVNAVNARLRSADNIIHMLVDPKKAAHVVADFENVTCLEGGTGELYKPSSGAGSEYTHLTDAIGYYVLRKHGVGGKQVATSEVFF